MSARGDNPAAPQRLELAPRSSPSPDDAVTFIGNATLLLRLNGIMLLTDPNFLHAGDHAHLGYGLSSKRLTNPAVELAALPPFDAVLLSHYHGDHFDQNVERELPKATPIVTTAHAAHTLERRGFTATTALATWESLTLHAGERSVRVTAMPGRHGPQPLAAVLPPVMGSLIEVERPGAKPRRIYISGDTLVYDALRDIPRRFPDIDVAFFHLGGTRILGVLVTLDGKGGVQLLRIIEPQRVYPIHYEEYSVMRSPLSAFLQAADAAGYASRIGILKRGEEHPL